jgi:hypothetical protein
MPVLLLIFTRKAAIRLSNAAAFASEATLIFVRQAHEWLRLSSGRCFMFAEIYEIRRIAEKALAKQMV